MTPEAIIDELKASGLRGRGGAGFPTGMKWSFVPRNTGKPTYIICNSDESEPGTCKDRLLMQNDPHQLLEGMMIAGFTIGSNKGYIFIRGEYRYLIPIVDQAIAEAYKHGYLGKNILGSGWDFDIYTHTGAGRLRVRRRIRAAGIAGRQARHSTVETAFPGGGGRISVPDHSEQLRNVLSRPGDFPRRRGLVRGHRIAEEWRYAVDVRLGSRE